MAFMGYGVLITSLDQEPVKLDTTNRRPMDKSAEGRDPSGFLSEIIGAPVTVKLNSGIVYKGMQVSSD